MMSQYNDVETTTLISRRAVFDSETKVCGYELLPAGRRTLGVPDRAHSSFPLDLLQRLTNGSLDEFVGSRSAHLRVTEDFLRSGPYQEFPGGRVCFLLDAVVFSSPGTDRRALEELFQTVRRDGYRMGLYGVTRDSYAANSVAQADVITIDTEALGADDAVACADEARRVGTRACAQRVETDTQFSGLRDHFALFEGRFYQRRSSSEGGVSTGRLATLQLLAECANPDASLEAFESIIGRDPSLTLRVMQLANSGFASLSRRLNSVREALITVGVTNIRNLAMIASLNRIEDQHPELLLDALVRAKVCELLARGEGLAPSSAFTAGLLSTLDLFLGVSVDEATEKAGLNDELRSAIVDHEGRLGTFVASAIGMERGEVERATSDAIGAVALGEAYVSALRWAGEVVTNPTP